MTTRAEPEPAGWMMMPPPLAESPLSRMIESVTCSLAVTPLGAKRTPMPGALAPLDASHPSTTQFSRNRAAPFWKSMPMPELVLLLNDATVRLRSFTTMPVPFTTRYQAAEPLQSMVIDFVIVAALNPPTGPGSRQRTSPPARVASCAAATVLHG